MAEDSDEEKEEEPTQKRLDEAREEGQVPRSRELTTFLMLAFGIGGLWMLSGVMGGGLIDVMRASMDFPRPLALETNRALSHLWQLSMMSLRAIAPLILLLGVVALIAPNLLGGMVISGKSMQPDLSKLNVFKGLKRQFGVQLWVELAKAIAKSVIILSIAAWYLYANLGVILNLANEPPIEAMLHSLNLMLQCAALMVLAFIIVVAIDVPYQLWSHQKKLRMSKNELKKEHKETEGDPQVKGKIRQQQQAMARQRMMSEVPDADVVVTNPTHFAIAMAYRDGEMRAPKVVAKGAGKVALKIRELGEENNVPILEAPPLARALYGYADLDQEIPAPLYTAVAEVLAWVYQLRRYRSEGGRAPDTPTGIEVPPELDDMTPEGHRA